MKKEEQGVITVEALIVLLPFMVFFLTLLNMSKMVQAQVLLQYVANETAKEISQYSYVLTKSGIVKKSNQTAEEAGKFKQDVNEVANNVNTIYDALTGMGNGGNISDNMNTIYDAANAGADVAEAYFDDPSKLLSGVVSVGKNEASSIVKRWMIAGITKSKLNTHFSWSSKSADEYLKNLGVVDGVAGLNFDDSAWFSGTDQDIKISITYKIKTKIMFTDVWEKEVKVTAMTRIW